MIWKILHHYASAIGLRAHLLTAVQRAKHQGNILPKGIFPSVWKEPHNQEEYIWLLRFISNQREVRLLDIGGNSGYWAQRFIDYYPKTNIVAFEPVPEMYEQYVNRFSGNPSVAVYNTALGEVAEQRDINVAEGYGLTSFNVYGDQLKDKNQHFKKQVAVQVSRLDDFESKIDFQDARPVIIKVDVQGFETKVLRGGKSVFNHADVIILECSFVNEFKGQKPTFGELTALLRELDLHPVQFGVFDRTRGPIAYERNVLFVKSKYFSSVWNQTPNQA